MCEMEIHQVPNDGHHMRSCDRSERIPLKYSIHFVGGGGSGFDAN